MAARAFPVYTRGEWLADLGVHVTGVTVGLVAVAGLIGWLVPHTGSRAALGLSLYAPALLAMLGSSAAYNLTVASPRKGLLRRLDHAAIFVLIAGTYSPFALAKIGGDLGMGLFAANWALAVVGALHAVVWPRFGERLEIVIYLLMGWSILVALDAFLSAATPPVVALLLGGGVVYTAGVGFHAAHRLKFHNAIWHALVLVAAGMHYAAMWVAFA
ncbi:hemolysin III [Limimonas halophila]|uniref:Hemolysin III n=1 Tax=Limimonas halophila TaxID=1082479 RepID=A0A1G7Q4M6_9PROT|nr:hemolysin III family protein [Limimonas halophila]SDF93415.1 hemolysin III [Limimonas halophila]